MIFYQLCLNEGPRVQDGSAPGGSYVKFIEVHRKIFKKNHLLQNHLAQLLEVWCVAIPSGLLPS